MATPRTSRHTAKDWSDQWRRVQRWHGRVSQVRTAGLPTDGNAQDGALDFVYAYFKEAFSLLEWVRKSGHRSPAEVRQFLSGNTAIGLCRDIANGLKHFELDPQNAASVDLSWNTATVVGASVVISGNRGRSRFITPPASSRWVVRAAGRECDMFELANECLELWKAFLLDSTSTPT
jgi:hypothetical protein